MNTFKVLNETTNKDDKDCKACTDFKDWMRIKFSKHQNETQIQQSNVEKEQQQQEINV